MIQTDNWAPPRAPDSFPRFSAANRIRSGAPSCIRALQTLLLLGVLSIRAGSAPAPEKTGPPRPRALLLVTLDTWRWEYLGAAGQLRIRTPNLDRLARDGAYLRRVQTSAPLTAPAHASLLTGLEPFHHGIRDNLHYRLAAGVPTLAEAFKSAGYATAAFVSASPLRSGIGLNRGFDHYDDRQLQHRESGGNEPAERAADRTLARAREWLERAPPGGKLFIWVHLYDPHAPFLPHPGAAKSAPVSPYAGEIEFVDEQIGGLLAELNRRFPRPGLRVVVTGDHGEGLGEHGEAGHGIALYDTTLAVPLILWPKPARWRDPAGPAALVDVAPTLRQWSGLPAAAADGRSLLAPVPPDRWLYAEAMEPTLSSSVSPAYALRQGGKIAFFHGGREVYDTTSDPGQLKNLIPGAGEPFYRRAEARLAGILARNPEAAIRKSATPADADTVRKLQALGYAGGATVNPATPWVRDDRRHYLRRYGELVNAQKLLQSGRLDEAAKGFEEFLKHYPDAVLARMGLAMVRVRQKNYPLALVEYETARRLDPDDPVVLLNLGNLTLFKGEVAAARGYYQQCLARDPDQSEALYNLARTYIDGGEPRLAVPYLRRFLEMNPDDREAAQLRALIASAESSAGK